MKSRFSIRALWLMCLPLVVASCQQAPEPQAEASAPVDTTRVLVQQIVRQSRLYTMECRVHKIVTFSDDQRLTGNIGAATFEIPTRWGDRKIAIPVDVTVKAYVDFSAFGPQNVERTDSAITITLPDPQVVVTASKIDHAAVRQYVDPLRSSFTDAEVLRLARQGEDSIVAHLPQTDLLGTSQKAAARALLPLLHRMGYTGTRATISFRSDLTPAEVRQNITLERLD